MNTENLNPNQHLVYFWLWKNEDAVKIGKSTIGSYYNSVIKSRTRYSRKIPIDLGCILFDSKTEAVQNEKDLHRRFNRINKSEWVQFTTEVKAFIQHNCIDISHKTFKRLSSKKRKTSNDYAMMIKPLNEKRQAIYMMFTGKSQKWVAEYFDVHQNSFSVWCQTEDFKQIRSEMLREVVERFKINAEDIL